MSGQHAPLQMSGVDRVESNSISLQSRTGELHFIAFMIGVKFKKVKCATFSQNCS